MRKTKSPILAAVRDKATELHRVGVMDEVTMREFGPLCLRPVEPLAPVQIKRIRESSRVSQAVFALFGRAFVEHGRTRDRLFTAEPTCTSCGICAHVCPVENVRLVEGRPKWLGHCEQCFACIHFCPVAAIQVQGKRTRLRGRYHHPDVTADDIAGQKPSVRA